MTTLNWARQITSGSATSSPFQTNVNCGILPAGCTIRRTIITFDWWVNSTTQLFVDVGADIAYGVSLGTSSSAPSNHPHTDAGATGTPNVWLYWDSLGCWAEEVSDVAGTIVYIAKNTDANRHIDTRAQRKNTTSGDLYVWFGIQANGAFTGDWSGTSWSVGSQILYEGP